MHDSGAVQGIDAGADLPHHVTSPPPAEAAVLTEQNPEIAALEQLHDHEHHAGRGRAVLVRLDDVGMLDLGTQPRLPQEPIDCSTPITRARVEDLDRYASSAVLCLGQIFRPISSQISSQISGRSFGQIRGQVFGEIHRTHSAPSERANQAISSRENERLTRLAAIDPPFG
jgi:hypothetical protein